jgi:hypothetical protein
MLYIDDDAHADLLCASGLLIVACASLDALLFQHGHQAECIMAEKYKAYIGLHDLPVEIGRIVIEQLNESYKRANLKPIAEWLDEELGILLITVTKADSLAKAN